MKNIKIKKESLREIKEAEKEIKAGKGISTAKLIKELKLR